MYETLKTILNSNKINEVILIFKLKYEKHENQMKNAL
jgi:hypothetical protein